MVDFYYTKHFGVSSSLVDDVYYNENENFVVIDLDDAMYKYDGVTSEDVTALVKGADYDGSVGKQYNFVFKTKHGPGEYLGQWDDVDYDLTAPIAKTGGVPKDLTNATTISGQTVTGTLSSVPATKEFSLKTPPALKVVTSEDDSVSIRVHFRLDGSDEKYKYDADATTVDEAVEELNKYVSRLKARGVVTKVVVKFE